MHKDVQKYAVIAAACADVAGLPASAQRVRAA